jgi:hypothetical protein
MRKLCAGILGAVALWSLGAGTAQAITFDLRFQSTEGLPWNCTAGATYCKVLTGSTVLIDVVFTINVDRIWTSTSVALDLSAMGLANTAVTATAFAPPFAVSNVITLNGVFDPVGDTVPAVPDTGPFPHPGSPCTSKLPGCDHRFSSFGFANPTSVGSGYTYTAGTITLDLTGANMGTFTIATYYREGVDIPSDNANNPHNVAILDILGIPEPATAALLGLGLVALAAAAHPSRRRGR